jgi:hypothetical protein
MRATMFDIIESIADDVNDTIRLEYKLGSSFTTQEIDTLIESKIPADQDFCFMFDLIKESVDQNLIGA